MNLNEFEIAFLFNLDSLMAGKKVVADQFWDQNRILVIVIGVKIMVDPIKYLHDLLGQLLNSRISSIV